MESRNRQLLSSGIEPVDKLLGGLESGLLYLVHGEAAGKSLFGIKFLIEGLKRGENAALVIRYSPEDAVRRFARLGYDCLDDIYSGRLVILEHSDDIVQQIARLQSITPVLRELEWLLGETRPSRLVLDPVTSLVVSDRLDLEPRVDEFTVWAHSFGATVVLVANGDSQEVIQIFKPLVEESFRFDVIETAERATRSMVFEKSELISPQAIEVDPSRGVFLVERSQNRELDRPALDVRLPAPYRPALMPGNAERLHHEEADAQPDYSTLDIDLLNETEPLAPDHPAQEAAGGQFKTEHSDILSALLDELAGVPSPFDVDVSEPEPTPPANQAHLASESGKPGAHPDERRGASTSAIDQRIAARAMEILLRPPELEPDISPPVEVAAFTEAAHIASQEKAVAPAPVDPKDFNVLVINDDQAECEFIAQALGEYTVETVYDGVSGLAKLIAFKPDLVILDVDLPIIDGFKVLAHIRSSLNMPIIIVSGSRVRASDRMLSTELGADYYLTKPYSVKELQQKSRQLIARYRGINSWIITLPKDNQARRTGSEAQDAAPTSPESHRFVSYNEFAAKVEKRIYSALDKGPFFSVVGCRLPDMTANAGRPAIRLYEMVRTLVRETDVISTSPRNDMVILLVDADTTGARAFVSRLRARVMEEMGQSLVVWVRSFPELQEPGDPSQPAKGPASANQFNRRASDRRNRDDNPPSQNTNDSEPGLLNARKVAATGDHTSSNHAQTENLNPES